MFTGIVEECGAVAGITRNDGHARLLIACDTVVGDAAVGDSISVSGCCLTVTEVRRDGPVDWTGDALEGRGFVADLMAETLRATALGELQPGAPVNLERAMAAGGRFGGHLVQGHVDAVGEVVGRDAQPGTVLLTFTSPPAVARYLVAKGSVTIDGTSLTVIDVSRGDDWTRFRVGVIPHTLATTTFGDRQPGDRVNLEADVVAKYVERLLDAGADSPYSR